ncbi:hypothetical protein [Aeromonas media]|uniref:hypothetical protein n=1 Tax=Aeromonas TaxID=642 RepID=UPI00384A5219
MKYPAQEIRAQFQDAFNLASALYRACNTDIKRLPYSKFVTLLYPLAEQLHHLNDICGPTHWSKFTHRMYRYSSVLVELLISNKTSGQSHSLRALLIPILTELKMVREVYAQVDSRIAAKAANSNTEDANQKPEEAELVKPQPSQKQPIRDGLVSITPPENINDFIASGLTGKLEDIWTRYQAYMPTDLTPEEVKILNALITVMPEEHLN